MSSNVGSDLGALTDGSTVRLVIGDEVYVSTRRAGRWVVSPAGEPEEPERRDHVAELVVPDEPEWRAWLEPGDAVGVLDATRGRVTTWHEGRAVTTAMPPADWPDFSAFTRFPREWRPRGVDLAVRFVMSGVPGGSVQATWIWRDGTLVGQSGDVPADFAPESIVDVRGPARPALEYLCGDRSIYSVLSSGSTVNGHPAMLQFFVGYLEQEGFSDAITEHQRLVRRAFVDYLEHPVAGVAEDAE